jgi:TonB family protein
MRNWGFPFSIALALHLVLLFLVAFVPSDIRKSHRESRIVKVSMLPLKPETKPLPVFLPPAPPLQAPPKEIKKPPAEELPPPLIIKKETTVKETEKEFQPPQEIKKINEEEFQPPAILFKKETIKETERESPPQVLLLSDRNEDEKRDIISSIASSEKKEELYQKSDAQEVDDSSRPGGSGGGGGSGTGEGPPGGEGYGTGRGSGRRLTGTGPGVVPGGSGSGSGIGEGHGGKGSGGGIGGGTGSGTGSGTGIGSGSGEGYGEGGSGTGTSSRGKGNLLYPQYGKNPEPTYPSEARKEGYQGSVLLWVEVLPTGRAGQVEIKRSSGYAILDQSALTQIKEWRFIPARQGGVAIPFWVSITLKFELK